MRIRVRERVAPEPASRAPERAEPARPAPPAGRAGRAVRGLALLGSPLLVYGLLAGVVPAFREMAKEVGLCLPALTEQVFVAGVWASSPVGLAAFLIAYGLLAAFGRRRAWLPTFVFLLCIAATAVVALALLLPLEPLSHI